MHRKKLIVLSKRMTPLLLMALSLFASCSSREERISRAISKADEARQRDETSNALTILGKAALKNPDSASLQEALGNTYLEANDPLSAIESFEKAIELDTKRQRLWVTVADLYERLGESLKSLESLATYLQSFPNDFLAWKDHGSIQETRGELGEAIQSYLEWNRIRPSAGPALKIGELFQQMGNDPQARSWTSQAAAYINDPQARDALASLINLEIQLQQYLPASTWLEQYDERYGANPSDPRTQEARSTIGRWRRAQQEIAEAAAELERERKELEQQAIEARRQQDEAEREREALLMAQETNPEIDSTQGDSTIPGSSPTATSPDSAGVEKPPVALADSPAPTESQPIEMPEIDYLPQARSAKDNGDLPYAIDLYWRALGPNSENAEIWFELASAYEETRNWLDAEACILEAKRRDPTSPTIAQSYLSIISQTQNANRVFEEAEALANLFPHSAPISLILAQTLREANAPRSRVSEAYEDFLQKAAPSKMGVEEARAYLGR